MCFDFRYSVSVAVKKVGKDVAAVEQEHLKLEQEKNELISNIQHFSNRIEQLSDDIYSYKSRIEKVRLVVIARLH